MRIIYCHHAQRQRDERYEKELQMDGITKLGEEDALSYAKILNELNIKITAIYSSPFKRCMDTANIVNKFSNAPIYEENRFNEYKSFKGETWKDCQIRIIEAIKDITNKHNEEDVILCVTSGVNISGFICWAYNVEPSDNIPFPMVLSCSPVAFDYSKDCKENNIDKLFK